MTSTLPSLTFVDTLRALVNHIQLAGLNPDMILAIRHYRSVEPTTAIELQVRDAAALEEWVNSLESMSEETVEEYQGQKWAVVLGRFGHGFLIEIHAPAAAA